MGVQLTEIVNAEELEIESLFDKTIAVDAFNWIHQFLSTIRQADGKPLMDFKGNTTSHLSGLFYRNMKLMEAGIKPVYVFDGKPPEMKAKERQRRRDIREEAKKEWKKALEEGREEDAKKFSKRFVEVTEEIVEGSKELLKTMGIPVVQAKSEGEALASIMTSNGDAFATATQDYDSLLFGCPKVIRNLSITGKKKRGKDYIIIKPEMIELNNVLKSLNINQDQLICIAILVGTDYNQGGVKGFGPKKALEHVKGKTPKEIFSEIKWEADAEWEDIFEFFKNPPVGEYNIKEEEFDKEKIRKILVNDHDFSEDRINNSIDRLEENKKAGQKSLQKWFK